MRILILAITLTLFVGCDYLPFSGGRLDGSNSSPPEDWSTTLEQEIIQHEFNCIKTGNALTGTDRVALASKELNYDFVFIDTPPSLNSLTLDALISSDGTLIPLQCEYYSLEGITSLVNTINELTNSGLTNNKILYGFIYCIS